MFARMEMRAMKEKFAKMDNKGKGGLFILEAYPLLSIAPFTLGA